MLYLITKNGKCVKHRCKINEVNKTVSTTETGLVFDFSGLDGWIFVTSYDCTFYTGHNCRFKTSHSCTFQTGHTCKFDTLSDCKFNTLYNCSFNASHYCTFKTGKNCTLTRHDFNNVVIELLADVTIKSASYIVGGIPTYQLNTKEYAHTYLNEKEAMMLILKEGEWFLWADPK